MAEQSHDSASRYRMGIATTSYMGVWRPKDTYEFLEHCHALGAAGIQAPLNGDLEKLRARAEELRMYIEGWAPMPKDGDTSAFERTLKDAKTVNAIAIRTACLDTRRYETFSSYTEWQDFVAARGKSIESALPILDRYKIPLGIENHKDWLADDLAEMLAKHSSEYLGACLDFGNNVSLLDDPMHVIEVLAPYTVSTHFKDIAVAPANQGDGFLLSEVILGQGMLDLPRAVSLVQQARPATRISLEMITRDPLHVPCFSDKYWATFPDRNGIYLARTFRLVHHHSSELPTLSGLSHGEQLTAEEQNVIACLRFAHQKLAL